MSKFIKYYTILIALFNNQLFASNSDENLPAVIEHASKRSNEAKLAARVTQLAGCLGASTAAAASAGFCLGGLPLCGFACGAASAAVGCLAHGHAKSKYSESAVWSSISQLAASPDDRARTEMLSRVYSRLNIPNPSFDIARLNDLVLVASRYSESAEPSQVLELLNKTAENSEHFCMLASVLLGLSLWGASRGSTPESYSVPVIAAAFVMAYEKARNALASLAAYNRLRPPKSRLMKIKIY